MIACNKCRLEIYGPMLTFTAAIAAPNQHYHPDCWYTTTSNIENMSKENTNENN